MIELFKYEETGYGDILSLEFVEWRNRKTDLETPTRQVPAWRPSHIPDHRLVMQ